MKTQNQNRKNKPAIGFLPKRQLFEGKNLGKIVMALAFVGILFFVFGALAVTVTASDTYHLATVTEQVQPASANVYVYSNNVLWKGNLTTTKSLTVGTKKNKGKLYVKGYLQNPNKNKPLRVKDNMEVKGNLTVSGNLTISGSSKLLGTGIIGAQNLGEGVVTAEKLGNAAVTTEKIYDEAVTAAKLADSSVTSAKIQNGTVSADDLASDSVTSAKIANGTITGSDIASSTITTSNIDLTGNGFVKAGVYVSTMGADSTPSQQFNNLSGGSTITSDYLDSPGQYTLDFGTTITSNYFQVIARDAGTNVHIVPIIYSVSTSKLTIQFSTNTTPTYADPDTGFYVLVY